MKFPPPGFKLGYFRWRPTSFLVIIIPEARPDQFFVCIISENLPTLILNNNQGSKVLTFSKTQHAEMNFD